MEKTDKHLLSVKGWYSLSMLHTINGVDPLKQWASFPYCFGRQFVEVLFSTLFPTVNFYVFMILEPVPLS